VACIYTHMHTCTHAHLYTHKHTHIHSLTHKHTQFNMAKSIPGKEEFHETIRYFNKQLKLTGLVSILSCIYLQRTTTHCNTLQHTGLVSVSHSVAVCRNVLQCVAMCCSVLYCAAVGVFEDHSLPQQMSEAYWYYI